MIKGKIDPLGRYSVKAWGVSLLLLSQLAQAIGEAPEISFDVEAFNVVGQLPFSDEKVAGILAPFKGSHSGLEGLQAAGDALESELRQQGYAFFEVSLPPQTLTGGVVSLEVLQQRIGSIVVQGQKYFDENNAKASVPTLVEGLPPNTREISRSVKLANENPSKSIKVSFKGGQRPGEVDATIKVVDQREWNIFTSLSNTGNNLTGKWRNTIGFQHNNLFNRDHNYTMAATYAPGEGSVVSQYSLNYRLPLYTIASSVDFYFSTSDVDTGIVNLNSAAGGSAEFGSLLGGGQVSGVRFNHSFLNIGKYRHSFSLALEDKFVDNNTLISRLGVQLNDRRRSTPLTLSYDMGYQYSKNSWSAQLQYAKNVELNNHNDQSDYDTAPGTPDVDWDLWRTSIYQDVAFGPGWIWRLQLSAQRANQVLIAGEKYGIGGVASVRGYEERISSGDNAQLVRNELWLKPVGAVRPVLFYDWGESTNLRSSATGLKTKQRLAGFGLGFRYSLAQRLSAQLDVARARNSINRVDSGDVRAHFNLFARF